MLYMCIRYRTSLISNALLISNAKHRLPVSVPPDAPRHQTFFPRHKRASAQPLVTLSGQRLAPKN